MDDRAKHLLEGVAVVAVVLTVGLLGAGEADGANQAVTAEPTDVFAPAHVTVSAGEKVTWTNGGGLHNVVFDDGTFTEPPTPSTSAWTTERTFSSAGTFGYYCERHRSTGMTGTVTVVNPSMPAPPGAPPPGGAPPGSAPPTGPPAPARPRLKVTLQVSDFKPRRGARVRFSGSVRPQYDGRVVRLQRRLRSGAFRTVATTRLRDAGKAHSTYGRRLRILGDGVFRSRVAGDRDHASGVSRTRRVQIG